MESKQIIESIFDAIKTGRDENIENDLILATISELITSNKEEDDEDEEEDDEEEGFY